MLFRIIEHFRDGHPHLVGQRFKARGCFMPDGSPIACIASWMSADGTRRSRLMEAPARADLDPPLPPHSLSLSRFPLPSRPLPPSSLRVR